MSEKRCPHCGETKPHSEFHRRSDRPDGLQYYCRDCNIGQRTKRREDPDFRLRMRINDTLSYQRRRIAEHDDLIKELYI